MSSVDRATLNQLDGSCSLADLVDLVLLMEILQKPEVILK